jgi:hypothetical protein
LVRLLVRLGVRLGVRLLGLGLIFEGHLCQS